MMLWSDHKCLNQVVNLSFWVSTSHVVSFMYDHFTKVGKDDFFFTIMDAIICEMKTNSTGKNYDKYTLDHKIVQSQNYSWC